MRGEELLRGSRGSNAWAELQLLNRGKARRQATMEESPVIVWRPGGQLVAAVPPSWLGAEEGLEGNFRPLPTPPPSGQSSSL